METNCVVLFLLLGASGVAVQGELIKGISYGPVPLRSSEGVGEVSEDDWFCDEAVPMWGPSGRGDLAIMRQLGANMVRLYGNNPEKDHTNFLDEAFAQGLSVSPGFSDFPYFQQQPGNCEDTDFDCFSQVQPLYLQNLRNGFLKVKEGTTSYHPAIQYMNIINEPDLKMPWNADTAGIREVHQMCRSIISAFDGMLQAEKEAGVSGPLINFTATFSFAVCSSCEFFIGRPALAQMSQLDDAMHHPEKYDYSPRNNITAAYIARFTHSFNTQNSAADVKRLFLDDYEKAFPTMPVYIAEYHQPGSDLKEDLRLILQYAMSSPLFLGISFFQFQVAYWKKGTERDFGMFGLSHTIHGLMPYGSKTYDVYCLESNGGIPEAVAEVYHGPGIDTATLCAANPLGAQLDQAGYAQIASQHSTPQMELFVQHAIRHMGASVKEEHLAELREFAHLYSGGVSSDGFAEMAAFIGSRPDWIEFDPRAKCVADRSVHPSVIGAAIGWVCSNGFDCESVPPQCNSSTYRLADYVFSRYADRHGDLSNPLVSCSFGGAALFAPSKVYTLWDGTDMCLIEDTMPTMTSTVSITTSLPADSNKQLTWVTTDDPDAMSTSEATFAATTATFTRTKFLDMSTAAQTFMSMSTTSHAAPGLCLVLLAILAIW